MGSRAVIGAPRFGRRGQGLVVRACGRQLLAVAAAVEGDRGGGASSGHAHSMASSISSSAPAGSMPALLSTASTKVRWVASWLAWYSAGSALYGTMRSHPSRRNRSAAAPATSASEGIGRRCGGDHDPWLDDIPAGLRIRRWPRVPTRILRLFLRSPGHELLPQPTASRAIDRSVQPPFCTWSRSRWTADRS